MLSRSRSPEQPSLVSEEMTQKKHIKKRTNTKVTRNLFQIRNHHNKKYLPVILSNWLTAGKKVHIKIIKSYKNYWSTAKLKKEKKTRSHNYNELRQIQWDICSCFSTFIHQRAVARRKSVWHMIRQVRHICIFKYKHKRLHFKLCFNSLVPICFLKMKSQTSDHAYCYPAQIKILQYSLRLE